MHRRDILFSFLGFALVGTRVHAEEAPKLPLYSAALLAAHLREVTVLHVGRKFLFTHQHVPGSRHAGEVVTPEGFTSVVAAIKAAPKAVVLYCGCCPLDHCVSIPPAGRAALASGRKDVFILDLPTNFDRDWVGHRYPVERG